MLEWVFRRCDGDAEAVETPIGLVPAEGDLNTDGLDIDPDDLAEVLRVDSDELRAQLPQVKEHLAKFGDQLPAEVRRPARRARAAARLVLGAPRAGVSRPQPGSQRRAVQVAGRDRLRQQSRHHAVHHRGQMAGDGQL